LPIQALNGTTLLAWTGRVIIVARLTSEPGLGSYVQKNIWKPPGIIDAAFVRRI
jgi:hypothetical protein